MGGVIRPFFQVLHYDGFIYYNFVNQEFQNRAEQPGGAKWRSKMMVPPSALTKDSDASKECGKSARYQWSRLRLP